MNRFAPGISFLALLVTLLWAPSSRAAEDELPYRAYVVAGEADVRSGPGDSYYATERLPLGAEVEVHRRDPGGWLAIRPPADSFCWIPADKLELTDQTDVAQVVAPDAVAWMGSNVQNVSRHRWQVRLEPGERVAVLGSDAREDGAGKASRTWYKIAPPAGEFRWVHGDDVRRVRQASRPDVRPTAESQQAAAASRATDKPRAANVVRKSDSQMTITTKNAAASPRAVAGGSATDATSTGTRTNGATAPSQEWVAMKKRPTDKVRHAAYETDEPTGERSHESSDSMVGAPRRRGTLKILNSPEDVAQAQALEAEGAPNATSIQAAAATSDSAGQVGAADRAAAPGAVASSSAAAPRGEARVVWAPKSPRQEVQQLDAAPLGAASAGAAPAAAGGRTEADLEREDIELQLSQMVVKAPQLWNLAALRGRTEALIERAPTALERGQSRLLLEKIAEWEDHYDRQVQVEKGVVVPQGGATPGTAGPATNARVEPRFDGSGWLFPVRSVARAAPPYAIVDESGAVLQYVTAAPGVNLHRYERKKVGIYGQRNSVRELSAPVLTAHRVIDIDRQTTR